MDASDVPTRAAWQLANVLTFSILPSVLSTNVCVWSQCCSLCSNLLLSSVKILRPYPKNSIIRIISTVYLVFQRNRMFCL